MSLQQSLNLLNPKFCKSVYTDSEIESFTVTLQSNRLIKFLRLSKFIVMISDEELDEKLAKLQILVKLDHFPSDTKTVNKCLEDVAKILCQTSKTQLQRHDLSAIVHCVVQILFFSGFGIYFLKKK